MNARRLAALTSFAWLAACGGTDELALNPVLTTALGGAGGTTMTHSGGSSSGTGIGGSNVTATAGTTSDSSQAGNTSEAGQGPSACSADLQCAAPTPRCSESGGCVACLSEDDCPFDGARRCSEQGRCVACVENEECGDNEVCETLTGTCQTCATADCTGAAGAASESGK